MTSKRVWVSIQREPIVRPSTLCTRLSPLRRISDGDWKTQWNSISRTVISGCKGLICGEPTVPVRREKETRDDSPNFDGDWETSYPVIKARIRNRESRPSSRGQGSRGCSGRLNRKSIQWNLTSCTQQPRVTMTERHTTKGQTNVEKVSCSYYKRTVHFSLVLSIVFFSHLSIFRFVILFFVFFFFSSFSSSWSRYASLSSG